MSSLETSGPNDDLLDDLLDIVSTPSNANTIQVHKNFDFYISI